MTSALALAEKFTKAVVTVGFPVIFLEGALAELIVAERTAEMLGMKLAAVGRQTPTDDRLLTSSAETAFSRVVVLLAVRSAFMLKETPGGKVFVAGFTHEALRVPVRVQGRQVV